jgi:hypothetical protein
MILECENSWTQMDQKKNKFMFSSITLGVVRMAKRNGVLGVRVTSTGESRFT